MWIKIVLHIPKGQRFSIGSRIENKFLDLLEIAHVAYFTEKEKTKDKEGKVAQCISTLDSLKLLIQVAWESQILTHSQYAELAENLADTGRMLGGWKKSFENPEKKNRAL